jgi:hypothetical protein
MSYSKLDGRVLHYSNNREKRKGAKKSKPATEAEGTKQKKKKELVMQKLPENLLEQVEEQQRQLEEEQEREDEGDRYEVSCAVLSQKSVVSKMS